MAPSPAPTRGARSNDKNPQRPAGKGDGEPADHALGRSRGGWTSKVHLTCDGRGLPLSVLLTGGNVNDTTMLAATLDGIRVPRPACRPRVRPDRLLADKGYSSRANRALLRRRGIPATIPERDDQRGHRRARGRSGGRPYAFDRNLYKRRNVVERCFNRLKQWRAIATRYDKKAVNYRSGILIASLILWAQT